MGKDAHIPIPKKDVHIGVTMRYTSPCGNAVY